MSFTLKNHELAGLNLAGIKLKNGKIKLSQSNRLIPNWPTEITLLGETYTLEDVVIGSTSSDGETYENAVYV